MFLIRFFLLRIIKTPQFIRRSLLIGIDSLCIALSVWISFLLLGQNNNLSELKNSVMIEAPIDTWLLLFSQLIGLPSYFSTGQYIGLSRYVGSLAIYKLVARNALVTLLTAFFGVVFQLYQHPIRYWFIFWLVLSSFTVANRLLIRDLLQKIKPSIQTKIKKVVIYGAGSAGAQLASAIRLEGSHQIISFIDDNKMLSNREIDGIPIVLPSELKKLSDQTDQVLLAIATLSKQRRYQIIENLRKNGLPVLEIPSLDEITSGQININTLKPISIEEILGRETVLPDPNLLGVGIKNSCICVTGAGGSIGSELCNQIINFEPRKLIILDHSEVNLYSINQDLIRHKNQSIEIKAILANAVDSIYMFNLFREEQVDIIFHAAAYKHVPLVEKNPLSGLFNNVFSTYAICEAAKKTNVNKVLLISSDKAVRPTNVMGASKRLSELIIQAFAFEEREKERLNSTEKLDLDTNKLIKKRFVMVRFGNVLDSSGSVVQLFRNQIIKGGPLTVTHREVVRYFMTIYEAVQLVLQSSVLAEGGEVFLIQMGEQVRIYDLAEQMIKLSGLKLRNHDNPDGDIEIITTGMRPGEKLYEELLIDAKSIPTSHPLIFRANEKSIHPSKLLPRLEDLRKALVLHEKQKALKITHELVPEWQCSLKIDNRKKVI